MLMTLRCWLFKQLWNYLNPQTISTITLSVQWYVLYNVYLAIRYVSLYFCLNTICIAILTKMLSSYSNLSWGIPMHSYKKLFANLSICERQKISVPRSFWHMKVTKKNVQYFLKMIFVVLFFWDANSYHIHTQTNNC